MTTLTADALPVALMSTATTLPALLVGLPAGSLADRVDRRRLLLATQAWMLLCASLLAVLTVMGVVTPWLLLALTFALGIGAVMNGPTVVGHLARGRQPTPGADGHHHEQRRLQHRPRAGARGRRVRGRGIRTRRDIHGERGVLPRHAGRHLPLAPGAQAAWRRNRRATRRSRAPSSPACSTPGRSGRSASCSPEHHLDAVRERFLGIGAPGRPAPTGSGGHRATACSSPALAPAPCSGRSRYPACGGGGRPISCSWPPS